MTDRIMGFTVTLEREMREDDADHIKRAIASLRGVVDVQGVVDDVRGSINRAQIRADFMKRLWKVFE